MSIELVTSACNGISFDVAYRWRRLVVQAPDVQCCIVTDDPDFTLPDTRICHVTRRPSYDIGAVNNVGIRSSTADIIVKTDLDVVILPAAMQGIRELVAPGMAVVFKCSNIDVLLHDPVEIAEFLEGAAQTWRKRQIRAQGRGACFAMDRLDWHRLRGYDERFKGHGGDDDNMWHRAEDTMDVCQTAIYPIFHLNHPPRTGAGGGFTRNGPMNLARYDHKPWQLAENSEKWGLMQ